MDLCFGGKVVVLYLDLLTDLTSSIGQEQTSPPGTDVHRVGGGMEGFFIGSGAPHCHWHKLQCPGSLSKSFLLPTHV
jgi:hypothetical protein